ncbi:hypothetical protein EBE87_10685 [Pseudoroseomonas wenyumeiae]|uniref:Uncharacterized protein n=1 Tax=Teichococcus wenyumeiae TaxID=2478470 RepID=A0A3A9JK65_9PROT|nr:hypothetical protein D6Z83_03095 [Pseudoroseomonas wenyumeiae]RMI25073.1 hypothetical protein EBE87_10685 [Pseudoroseomonas wenyumeiae]
MPLRVEIWLRIIPQKEADLFLRLLPMFFIRGLKPSLLRFWHWVSPGGYRPERHYMRGLPRQTAN